MKMTAGLLTGIKETARAFSRMMMPAAVFSLLVVTQGCGRPPLFDQNKSFENHVWNLDDIIRFDVNVTDTVHIHKYFLNVRHSTDYRYANLYVFINSTFPDGRQARDTVECILAEPSGKWLGKGISTVRDNQILLRRGLRFPKTGNYIFEIEQAMREEELNGIMDIGIRIERE